MSKSTRHRLRGQSGSPKASAGQIRIIAGEFRGRLLPVPVIEGLRPTGDRVRETLFNWLHGQVAGAHCLDLFAGSGALGLEALSRRAASVVLVEPDAKAREAIARSCETLQVPVRFIHLDSTVTAGASTADLFAGTAEQWLQMHADCLPDKRYDIVFIDPPFQQNSQWLTLQALVPRYLNNNALVYIESPKKMPSPDQLPADCHLLKDKCFGDVRVRLVRYARQ